MPLAPARSCGVPGCRALQPCPTHPKAASQSFAARRESEPWRALYDTQKWRKRRKAFLAEHPLCEDCDAAGLTELATTVDHRIPHRGNEVLFWDETNWGAKCASHHSSKTAREVWHGERRR